jgi:uncharacterized BrkB/YihY/UPF0761 family membrane protein
MPSSIPVLALNSILESLNHTRLFSGLRIFKSLSNSRWWGQTSTRGVFNFQVTFKIFLFPQSSSQLTSAPYKYLIPRKLYSNIQYCRKNSHCNSYNTFQLRRCLPTLLSQTCYVLPLTLLYRFLPRDPTN